MAKISMALIGLGKIARDQHVPAIYAGSQFELVAGVTDAEGIEDLPCFATVSALMRSGLRVDAVAICTPPQVRAPIAHEAIAAGLHVMLEKPPATTTVELEAVRQHALERSVSLFAAWHSRFAPQLPAARQWLAGRALRSGRISWREDVHKWHPGQRWLWQPGGPGVFDPGINALAILTDIVADPLQVLAADFEVPANAFAPIAARLSMSAGSAGIDVDFDFRQQHSETWEIALQTVDGGSLLLSRGGAQLAIDAEPVLAAPKDAYPLLYQRFAELIRDRASDCDATPLRLVEEAFAVARTVTTEAFEP